MRYLLAGFVAASCLASASASAQSFNTRAFSLDAWSNSGQEPSLLSESATVTRINLLSRPINSIAESQFEGWNDLYQGYRVSLHSGYRITGFTLQTKFDGEMRIGYLPPDEVDLLGRTSNSAWLQMRAGTGSQYYDARISEVTSPRHLEGSVLAGDLPSEFDLTVWGSFDTTAMPTWGRNHCGISSCRQDYAYSFSRLTLREAVLTVHTAPVPEPETYAMLLGGLAITGFVARRRQLKARQAA